MTLPSIREAYWLALSGYFALLILITSWITVLAPPQRFPIALLLIVAVVPLLLPLRGLLHGRPRTANWAAYLSMPYLIHGIMETAAGTETRWLGGLEILASLWLVIGCGLYLYLTKPRG